MNHARIAQKLFCEPWLINPTVHESLVAQFANADPRPRAMEEDNMTGDDAPVLRIDGALAILPIHGIIGKHLGMLETMCGGVDLNAINGALDQVQQDDAISTLILDIRSPGGIATGVPESAARIVDLAASDVEVIAYADSEMCSAGYWLGAAANRVVVAASAIIGSISSYMAGVDDSAAWKEEGLERILAKTGKFKAMGLPGKPWTAAEKKLLEERNAECGNAFKDFVAAQRPTSARSSLEGQWFSGTGAVNAGLADDIAPDLTTLVAMLYVRDA